jgi:hypothetical protein
MDVKVIVLRDGNISILVEGEGDFEQAKREIRSVIGELQADGIPLENISKVERHRHMEDEKVQQGVLHKTGAS